MQEIVGDIWQLAKPNDVVCITTNGTVKKNGECVMGRGIALEAKHRYPGIDQYIGELLTYSTYGNNVYYLGQQQDGLHLMTFPVKHNWWENADTELIKRSYLQVVSMLSNGGPSGLKTVENVYLGRPGCGNGKLDWYKDVKPVLEPISIDKIIIVSK